MKEHPDPGSKDPEEDYPKFGLLDQVHYYALNFPFDFKLLGDRESRFAYMYIFAACNTAMTCL